MSVAAVHAAPGTGRKKAPGPNLFPVIGVLREARKDALNFFVQMSYEYGDVVRFNTGLQSLFLLSNPLHVEHVLASNHRNYRKSKYYAKVKSIFGEGMFTVDGDDWRRKRRLAQPAFHRDKLMKLGTVMTDVAQETVERWRPALESGQAIDLASEMMQVSLSVSIRSFMGADYPLEPTPMSRALTVLMKAGEKRIWSVFDFMNRLPTPENRRVERAVEEFDAALFDIIDARRESTEQHDDVLSMFMEVRFEDTGEPLTNKQLRDEMMTIITAGHETTAVAIAWTFYLLSKYPEVERKLMAEIDSVLGGRVPTVADLPDLPYTKMVAQETMRIFPPFWTMSREAIDDDEIGGYHIPADSAIMLCPYVVHRNRAFWPDPEHFDPERFRPELEATRPRYAYFPFGGGPRVCIGRQFALLEAQLLLPVIAQHYRMNPVPGHPVAPEPMISLRPRHGLMMTLSPRH